VVAPKIFEKIRGEFGLEPIPKLNNDHLRESWRLAGENEEEEKKITV